MKLSFRPTLMALLAASSLAAALPAAAARADLDAQAKSPGLSHVPDELLVQFKPGQWPAVREHLLSSLGLRTVKVLRGVMDSAQRDGELHLVKLPAGTSVQAAMQALKGKDIVRFAEPNWLQRLDTAPNDLTTPTATCGATTATPRRCRPTPTARRRAKPTTPASSATAASSSASSMKA